MKALGGTSAVAEVVEQITRDIVRIGKIPEVTVADETTERGRVSRAEHHREHINTERFELGPQRLAEEQVERLGRAIDREVRSTSPRGTRGDQDDPAAPSLHHRAGEVMRGSEHRSAVAGKERLPHVHWLVEEPDHVRVGTRVVDQQADVEVGGRCRELVTRIRRAEIQRERPRRGGDGGCHVVERLLTARYEHHVDAAVTEQPSDRGAHAFGCAGHDCPRPIALREFDRFGSRTHPRTPSDARRRVIEYVLLQIRQPSAARTSSSA